MMSNTSDAGLSSCQLTASPSGSASPKSALRLADHYAQGQPPTFASFSATVTAVAQGAEVDHPMSIVTARKRREQGGRMPVTRAA